jgi:hypothetical protein
MLKDGRYSTSPAVDSLLGITHTEKGTSLIVLGNNFFNQWFENIPLTVRGVLKLIE